MEKRVLYSPIHVMLNITGQRKRKPGAKQPRIHSRGPKQDAATVSLIFEVFLPLSSWYFPRQMNISEYVVLDLV
jgi:hypothetical protein